MFKVPPKHFVKGLLLILLLHFHLTWPLFYLGAENFFVLAALKTHFAMIL